MLFRPMPLRAVIENRDVIAPLLEEADWEALREQVRAKTLSLRLPCCDASAFPRVSKLGTRHFVHRRANGCAGSGETFQHLWLKAQIVEACRDAGWEPQPEVAGDGWRADVLATRGSARVAFEVQWSRQEAKQTRFRQERYAADGVRACWLLRGDPPAPATRDCPVFRLVPDDDHVAIVEHAGVRYGVSEFVGLLLGGHVVFTDDMFARLRVGFVEMDCWRCNAPTHVYYAEQLSRCGHEIPYAFSRDEGDVVDEFAAPVIEQVQRWLAAEGGQSGVRLGAVKQRYSKTMEASYLSFGCASCDALFGDWFVRQAVLETRLYENADATFEVEIPAVGLEERQAHWCLPADRSSYCVSLRARQAA